MKHVSTAPMIALLFSSTLSFNSTAELSKGNTLIFGEGSKVSIEVTPGFWVDAPLQAKKGLSIGAAQKDKSIDMPFRLFDHDSQHVTKGPVTVIGSAGGSAQLDFSAWAMNWKGNVVVLGASGDDAENKAVATMKCESSCKKGETFTLDYSTTLPSDTEIIADLKYRLHLTGTIN